MVKKAIVVCFLLVFFALSSYATEPATSAAIGTTDQAVDPGSGSGGITITGVTETTNYQHQGVDLTVTSINGVPAKQAPPPAPKSSSAPGTENMLPLPPSCNKLGVISVRKWLETANAENGWLAAPNNKPDIKIVPRPTKKPLPSLVAVVGPILGSMDSPDILNTVICTDKGITISVAITRSSAYNGSALQNVLWRPRLEIELVPRQPEIPMRAEWTMNLTNGVAVHDDLNMRQQSFPAVIEKTLRP